MTKSTITREQAQKIIVAADEVITALAGTNEDVHPDDSKKMCELWDDLNDRHAPPVVVRELARMALTAMDSEPVAYAWVSRSGKKHLTRCEPEQWRDAVIVTPLYLHAQPAPVVSAELLHTAASAIEDLLTTKDRTGACVWFDLPFRLRSVANAQSPGREPATVPGKWIPVSERMPIPGVDVLVAKEFFGPGDWRRKVGHVRHEDGGWNIYGASWAPTHWMPLPAGPQEVKGERPNP